ncbi:hypothetical protein RCO48_37175 [Peribacillus frigoritolerans]|nr:hypothetical protein [Peribacillus frigoritolerans]
MMWVSVTGLRFPSGKNNEVLGFIWALEVNEPFTEEDMKFLQFAAKEAKNQLQQLQLKKEKERSRSSGVPLAHVDRALPRRIGNN